MKKMALNLFISIFLIQGCAAQKMSSLPISKPEVRGEQSTIEHVQQEDLNKTTRHLKKRIADLEAELDAAKKRAAETEKKLRAELALLKKQRDIAMDMGAFVERSLNEEIQRLNREIQKMKAQEDSPKTK